MLNQERRQVRKYKNLLSRTGSFMPLGIHQLLLGCPRLAKVTQGSLCMKFNNLIKSMHSVISSSMTICLNSSQELCIALLASKALHWSNFQFLRAATGFEFGDNEASVPKTEDNGVAQILFQVNIWHLLHYFTPPGNIYPSFLHFIRFQGS